MIKRYRGWALVAGASEGLGASFAERLASRGYDVLLVARRVDRLEALAGLLVARHGVEAVPIGIDLAAPDVQEQLRAAVAGREVGVLVCNAAFAPLGGFLDTPVEEAVRALDVNCRSTLMLLHALLPAMVARRSGGVVIMSSLTAFQGSPWASVYGSTKAFGLALAEGVAHEVAESGVDVIACCAGATRTPNYLARAAEGGAPGELAPEQVVEETLDRLGAANIVIPGRFNRLASWLMRLLPRSLAVRIMGQQTRKLQTGRTAAPPV